MKLELISFTPGGGVLGARLHQGLCAAGHTARHTAFGSGVALSRWTEEAFAQAQGLVFIGAAGIAVRAIAPHLKNKAIDPAVVVLDETGAFVIPLASGHLGGANDLARQIADLTGGAPAITTATDVTGTFAVDSWAAAQGLRILDPVCIKTVSAKLLAGHPIVIRSDFPIGGEPPSGVTVDNDAREYDVYISCKTRGRQTALKLIPPILTAGVGCRRQIAADEIGRALDMALAKGSLHPQAIRQVCSIDLKAAEPGLLELCRRRGLTLRCFTAAELAAAEGSFSASTFVQSVTGVDNVCERSAVLGSGGKIILKKQAQNGVTIALAAAPCVLTFESRRETP